MPKDEHTRTVENIKRDRKKGRYIPDSDIVIDTYNINNRRAQKKGRGRGRHTWLIPHHRHVRGCHCVNAVNTDVTYGEYQTKHIPKVCYN